MTTRRDALARATLAVLALSTPGSLTALAARIGRDRYLVVGLQDGRLLAVDLHDGRRAYLLELEELRDADLRLAESGSLAVRDGRVGRVDGPARTRHYELTGAGDSLLVSRRDRPDESPVRIPMRPVPAGRPG